MRDARGSALIDAGGDSHSELLKAEQLGYARRRGQISIRPVRASLVVEVVLVAKETVIPDSLKWSG
jgi:hypothetical protein